MEYGTMLKPGDRVGRYQIQTVAGEGGFGQVYRAWDPELERLVAIKELSAGRLAGDPARYAEYRERFRLERRVQGQFQHPHIVSVYDLVQQGEDEYLVEELMEGGTLGALLQREGRLEPERVVEIGMQVCQAIAAAWAQDIVHRDIKPSNILLSRDGRAKLGDFGVAQVGQMSQRTQVDHRHPGTPAYMSPEQEQGGGYLDERSDVYALGLVLYEALTGKAYKRERVPARQLFPELPKRLDEVVMRALANERAGRYQSSLEFEAALRGALDGARRGALGGLALVQRGSLIVLVAVIVGSWLVVGGGAQLRPASAPTAARFPLQPPLVVFTPAASPTLVPANATPAVHPSPSPTLTRPPASRTPAVSLAAPALLSPAGASTVTSSHFTFRWQGHLPSTRFGFQVTLRHAGRGLLYTSPLLDSTQWALDVPGDAVGEWRWSAAVVQREGEVVARSDEWTFYYDPFYSPFTSPLGAPLPVSPLATPSP